MSEVFTAISYVDIDQDKDGVFSLYRLHLFLFLVNISHDYCDYLLIFYFSAFSDKILIFT